MRIGDVCGLWGVASITPAVSITPGQQYTFAFRITAPAAIRLSNGKCYRIRLSGLVPSPVARLQSPKTWAMSASSTRTAWAARWRVPMRVGNVISRTRYEPYGFTASGAAPTIGFTGHVNDVDTGLTYMQQRYYDPVAGRFLSIDPVVTDGNTGDSFNRYAYGNNSPYKYVDPDGRNPLPVAMGVGSVGGGYSHIASQLIMTGDVQWLGADGVLGAASEGASFGLMGGIAGAGSVGMSASRISQKPKLEVPVKSMSVRFNPKGEKAVEIIRTDGTMIDISAKRVKEHVPNTHPKAPPGTMNKVKFENALPGTKGHKRAPTAAELKILEEAK